MATTLTKGRKYSDCQIDFAGWVDADGMEVSHIEGYRQLDWMSFFDGWTYSGADECGIEPLFEHDNPLPLAEFLVTIAVDAMGEFSCPQTAAQLFADYVAEEWPAFYPDADITVVTSVVDSGSRDVEVWSDSEAINGDSRFEARFLNEEMRDLWHGWLRTDACCAMC